MWRKDAAGYESLIGRVHARKRARGSRGRFQKKYAAFVKTEGHSLPSVSQKARGGGRGRGRQQKTAKGAQGSLTTGGRLGTQNGRNGPDVRRDFGAEPSCRTRTILFTN